MGVGRACSFQIGRCEGPHKIAVQDLDRHISDAVATYG